MKRHRTFFTLLFFLVLIDSLNAAQTLTVTTPGDPDSSSGGSANTLRNVLNVINQGATDTYTVNFNLPSGQETIVLQDMLPLLNLTSSTNTLIIDGSNNGNQIVLDGNSAIRGFFARQGNIAIQNITIQNTLAKGGNGAAAAGGGMGAGSALFIDQANVSLSNVTMSSNSVIGGNGGPLVPDSRVGGVGGGGGMGGNGGETYGGGGGLGGNGGNGFLNYPTTTRLGGGGGIGPGGDGGNFESNGSPGGAYGAAAAGDGFGVPGGTGGINGGGGGGGGYVDSLNIGGGGGGGIGGDDGTYNTGGSGGYGGGGGAFAYSSTGGFGGGGGAYVGKGGFGGGASCGSSGSGNEAGGFGGGGGGSTPGDPPGLGGTGAGAGASNLVSAFTYGAGGGGAGLGGAIFLTNNSSPGSLTVTGPLSISGGSVTAGTGANNGAAAATGLFVMSGTSLAFDTTAAVTINDSIGDDSNSTLLTGQSYTAGTGVGTTLVKNNTGILTLSGVNTYAGKTTINEGLVSISADSGLGAATASLKLNGGSLQTTNTFTLSNTRTLTTSSNSSGFDVTGSNTLTVQQAISDDSSFGGITKTGTGNLTLGGVNTYTGTTAISAGTLALSGTSSIETASNTIVDATLSISGTTSGATVPTLSGSSTGIVSLGTKVLTVNQGSAGTFAGSIQDNGGITKSGANTLTLSGVNTYTGATTISAGTLALSGSGSIETASNTVVNATLDISATTSGATIPTLSGSSSGSIALGTKILTVNQYSDGTFSGIIQDTGGLTKAGDAILTLEGVNTYSGLTTVEAGEFRLNGSIAADIIVQVNAFFSGIGTVGGSSTINSGGIISPGNDGIGTLNILGNYTQNPGSIYYLEIDGAGNSDRINITGAATLDGGQLVITSLTGTVLLNTPYLILTAADGVTGAFDSIYLTNLLQNATLIYDFNDVYVVFTQNIPPPNPGFHFHAVTCNQIAVARQFEGLTNPTSSQLQILEALAALSPAEQQHALNQMSGEQYASLNQASEIAGKQFIRRLYDPIRSIVTTRPYKKCDKEYLIPISSNPCCFFPMPVVNDCYYEYFVPIANENYFVVPSSTANDGSNYYPSPTFDTWFEIGGGQSFLNGNKNARGFKMSGYEITTGLQSTFCGNWTVGIAGSYVEDHLDFDIGNRGKNRMGFGALYGLYRPSKFYVLADLAFGSGQFDVNRSINIGSLSYSAKSHPAHYQLTSYVEGGFDLMMSRLLIQPFVGLETSYFRENSISEKGSSLFNLSFNKQTYNNACSRLGVHMTTEHWKSFKLSCDFAWDYRLTSAKRGIRGRFQSFGNDFKITGISNTRNSIDVALTGLIKLYEGWELYWESEGEFWANVTTYNFLGGIKYSW